MVNPQFLMFFSWLCSSNHDYCLGFNQENWMYVSEFGWWPFEKSNSRKCRRLKICTYATSRNRIFFLIARRFLMHEQNRKLSYFIKWLSFFIKIGFSYYLESSETCDEHIIFLKISFIITWINRTIIQCWSWWSADHITSPAWRRKKLTI